MSGLQQTGRGIKGLEGTGAGGVEELPGGCGAVVAPPHPAEQVLAPGRPRPRNRAVLVFTLVCLLGVSLGAAPGLAQQEDRFPSSDPDPRVGTPNDPRYDCSEPDDEDRGAVEPCHSIYDEQFNLFGFAPASTERTAV